MLISGVYHAIRTSAIFTLLTVGLCGTDRRFIFGLHVPATFQAFQGSVAFLQHFLY